MSNVKNYNIGQISLDMSKTTNHLEAPFVYYTHELPLLAFGDAQHTVDLSLVFNYERYRMEKAANNENPFFIAPGFKLNLQRRLMYDSNGSLTSFQGSNGDVTNLAESCNDLFTFDDESQRIIRRIEKNAVDSSGNALYDYTIENSDRSKEKYNEPGMLSEVLDKYGNTILSYTYNADGQLTAITFRGSKTITLEYVADQLTYIRYNA